jgi:hypothetical protein
MDPKLSHSITLFLGKLLACNKKRSKFLSAYEIQQLLETSSSGMAGGGGGEVPYIACPTDSYDPPKVA